MSSPLIWGLYSLLCAESFYTTEDEVLYSRYVFAGLLSCRRDDYTRSDMAASAGMGITLELITGSLYLTPGVYGGMFRVQGAGMENAWCAGAELAWEAGGFSLALNILRDMTGEGDIVYMLTAKGSF